MDIEPDSDMDTTDAPVVNANGVPVYTPVEVPPAPEAIMSFDGTGPRLMITHIVNENFKSYAGVQTLGPFHKSFSSIVGPNGSGKSNVIDSMLFVFGYRATKIRSKKISVLIHASDGHTNIDSCTVSVHFQKIIDKQCGDDDFEVVPNSQLVVSRTAFKDNSSYYRVGDRKVTYKEVAALLRGCGIDLDHNRFLILQGEVEQIAMMKPKAPSEHEDGMLEFLEDIIGSSRYKEPITVLASRVEELNELRNEKLNRVKAVEKEKDDLEGVKNEAVEYLTLENEIVEKKNVLFQQYMNECTEIEKKATVKRDQVLVRVNEINKRLEEINGVKKEKMKELKKTNKKLEDLNRICEEKTEEFKQLEQQDTRIREDLRHGNGQTKKLEKSLQVELKKLEELKVIPEKSEKEVADLGKQLEKLQADKLEQEEQLKKVMENFKTETGDLQKEKEAKERELLVLQKTVNETKSKYAVAQSELDLYETNAASETNKLAETQKNRERTSVTLKERRTTLDALDKKLPDVEKALEKAKKDFSEVMTAETKTADEVRQMRLRLEEARSSMSAARSQGKVLESLMQLKTSGQLPGIHGRLGDLGAIDEKYDVAISTACGALDHIVVDTINTAQKCVEQLKRSGAGIATFIGLDKMERWKSHCGKSISTPENVPRLFDLVRIKDEMFRPVFYFALRDTLVANDLSQATRIAYGKTRYRVVTLAGQLIEMSGTMSGGGGKVCKGKMGSSVIVDVDQKTVDDWQKQLEKGGQEVVHYRENRTKLEETVDKLQKQFRDMQHDRQKFALEIKSLADQENALQKQEAEQKQKVSTIVPDEKTKTDLQTKVAAFKKSFGEANNAAVKVENLVQSLHQQIMEIGGNKLKTVESRLNVIITQIDQANGQMNRASVAVKTAKRNAEKTVAKIEDLENSVKGNKQKLEGLNKEMKQMEVDATSVLEEHTKAKEAKKEVEAVLTELRTLIDKEDGEETELLKENVEEKHKLEKYEMCVKENQIKHKHWKKELERLSLHQIDPDKVPEKLATLTVEQLSSENFDKEDFQLQITKLEEQLSNMKPNLAAIAEYRKKEEMYLKRVSELDQITDLRNDQRRQHDDFRKRRLDEFMAGYIIITTRLKEMYQMITLGGDAELELVDSLDPFSEGIVFSVRPPKKSWKNISNLSGGEKTLSSLALVFALHHYKPTPLYVMDEIDAALDFKNVSIVANYIKERTRNAQFIIISLRNNMFELADRLIGIYKTYNCTKSVAINPFAVCVAVGADDSKMDAS